MPPVVIEAEGLSKRYRLGQLQAGYDTLRDSIAHRANRLLQREHRPAAEEIWALDGVSFTVEQGEVLGVIGPNGAGKSTLLKILTRITSPTKGSATIRGRVGSLLEVGTGFHGELTGRENVYLNGAILGMTRREITRKLPDIVEFSGVERFLDTPVKRYSSGMYVRRAFSVAAHLEPEILLVGEVLAVGDAEFQRRCLGRMEDFGDTGRTAVFVSHNMQAISQLCEPVGIEIGFTVLRRYAPLFPKIKARDGKGDIAFNAIDTIPRWKERAEPGDYTATAWIPANPLNEGLSSVDVDVCSISAGRL